MAKDISIVVAHKREPFSKFIYILYYKLRQRNESTNPLNRKLSFSDVSYVFGSIYRLPKELHFPFLKEMERIGLVEIKPYHYVMLRDDVYEG